MAIWLMAACSERPKKGDLQRSPLGVENTQKEEKLVDPVLEESWPASFGFGQRASAKDIARLDISIRPDGRGLPKGKGNSKEGYTIYQNKCVACHGKTGVEGPYDVLVAKGEQKAIGNYWPYATTLYDYIRRTMPFNMPGSLTDEEVYHLTAYLLHANGIIDSTAVMDAKSLPKVEMPAKVLFVPDDRTGGAEIR